MFLIFSVDLIVGRTQPAQGQLTDDLNRSGSEPCGASSSPHRLVDPSSDLLSDFLQKTVEQSADGLIVHTL